MSLELFPVYRGADRSLLVTLPSGDYTSATGLSAAIWPGDDSPALALPAAAWIDPAARTLRIDLTAAQSAALDAGSYPVQLSVTAGGKTAKVLCCLIEVRESPGSGTAPTVYGTYRDLLDESPKLDTLRDAIEDVSGFARQRGLARSWLDGLAHRHWYGGGRLDAWSVTPILTRDPWLAAQLAADRLVITPEVRRVVSLYALALIYRPRSGKEGDRTYRELGADYESEAHRLAACLTLEIDADGDGFGEVPIDLGTIRILRG